MEIMVLKFRGIELLTSQHKSLVHVFKVRKVKDNGNFASRRKTGKLNEGGIRSDFSFYAKYFKEVDRSLEGSWKVSTDKTYGWTKGPIRHIVTC